jgi:hypothetical protein
MNGTRETVNVFVYTLICTYTIIFPRAAAQTDRSPSPPKNSRTHKFLISALHLLDRPSCLACCHLLGAVAVDLLVLRLASPTVNVIDGWMTC